MRNHHIPHSGSLTSIGRRLASIRMIAENMRRLTFDRALERRC